MQGRRNLSEKGSFSLPPLSQFFWLTERRESQSKRTAWRLLDKEEGASLSRNDLAAASGAEDSAPEEKRRLHVQRTEGKSIRWLLTGVAFVSLLSLACIMLFLFMEGLPLFADYPLWDFLTGHLWYPTSEPPEFGIFPLIMGSLAVTILASCIAVPLGIMTAAYLAEIAASRTRRIVKPFVELLAALPSVVIGFFGMVIVAPFLQDWFGADTGLNLLNAALMLAFMSVPTICSVG